MNDEENHNEPLLIVLSGIAILAFIIVLGLGMAYVFQPISPEMLVAQAQAQAMQREADEKIRIAREEAQARKPVQVQVAEIEASKMSVGEGVVATGAVVGGVWLLGKMIDSM